MGGSNDSLHNGLLSKLKWGRQFHKDVRAQIGVWVWDSSGHIW